MLKYIYSLIFFNLFCNLFLTQTNELDSLRKKVYSKKIKDINRKDELFVLEEYFEAYLKAVNYDSLLYLATRYKNIAKSLNNKKELANSDLIFGRYFEKKMNYNKAISFYKKAETILNGTNLKKLKFECDNYLGGIYFQRDYLSRNLDSSIVYFENSLKFVDDVETVKAAKRYSQLSLASLLNGNEDMSKVYSNKILELLDGQNNNEIYLYYYSSKMDFHEVLHDKDSALYYGDLSFETSTKLVDTNPKSKQLKLWHLIKYSNCLYVLLEDDSAKKYFELAVEYASECQDISSFSKVFTPLSFIYSIRGEHESSISLCQKAIGWGQKIGDSAVIAKAKYTSTFSYGEMKNYQKAIEVYDELLLKYSNYIPISLDELYTNLSYNYYELKDFESAVIYGVLAKNLNRESSTALYNLADAYLAVLKDSTIDFRKIFSENELNLNVNNKSKDELRDIILSLVHENYSRSIDLIKASDNIRTIIHPYYGLGDYFDFIGDEYQAINNYQKAWGYSLESGMMEVSNQIRIAEKLYLFYRKTKKKPLIALNWLEVLDSLKEVNQIELDLEIIGRKQAQFEYSQKIYFDSIQRFKAEEVAAIKMEQREFNFKLIVLFGSVLFILILLVVYFLNRRKKIKVEYEVLKLEQKLLRTQMNPHFIFNSLTTIGGFVINNNIQLSYNYITKFSKLMRLILDSSRKDEISLGAELKIVENFLALLQMNNKDKLTYEIEVDESLDVDEYKVPPMLLQPFIENSIEHGGNKQTGECFVLVKFVKEDSYILMSVRDKGSGFSLNYSKSVNESYAIKITEERIINAKRYSNKKIDLQIKDLNNIGEEGVLVEFRIEI